MHTPRGRDLQTRGRDILARGRDLRSRGRAATTGEGKARNRRGIGQDRGRVEYLYSFSLEVGVSGKEGIPGIG